MENNDTLSDNLGRKFHYLRLSVTDVCNFRCGYCLPRGYIARTGEPAPLSVAEGATVMHAFARLGTSKLRLSGGEPSLRADLPDFIAEARNTPGIHRVAITSNGFKLHRVIDEWQSSGLDQINISIDSLDRVEFARITGHDCLQRILRGVDRAVELGVETKVNAVLLSDGAIRRLQQFLTWLKDTPVTVRFIELMQTGDNRDYFASNHLRGDAIERQLLESGWKLIARAIDAGPAREYAHTEYRGRIGMITPYGRNFCQSCNRLRVSAQGRLHLCLFAEQGLDLRKEIRSGDVGLLAEKVRALVADKRPSHGLFQGLTGATENLAMLGG